MPSLSALLARRILLGAALGLLAAGPGLAQPRAEPPESAAEPAGAADAGPIPAPPAEAPPEPARLSSVPAPMAPPGREAPLALPAGMEALPQGGWRIHFSPGRLSLGESATATLAELGRRLATRPQGRITLYAQASGPESDISAARRASLARALAVKQALAAGGLPPTRIDVRPMGRTEETMDAVDVQPPEARHAAAG
jgi:outer membrane protein OmpA-like peptidoglycan-associated protein